jgi:uncharacterized RDD family membrane protein YckC
VEEIVTGEAVILGLPSARFPTRILALLIDMVVQIAAFGVIATVAAVGAANQGLDAASGAAVLIAGLILVIVGYPVAFEALSRGRTLGKMALGLRVVADDGGPERFRQALVRALAGTIEIWALAGVPALITSMLSARGKRLGDIFAGTFVLRERAPRLAAVPYQVPFHQAGGYPTGFHGAAATPMDPGLRPWAASLDLSGLPDPLAASAASYLSRYWQLNEAARDQLGWQLAADVAARLSPPPPPGLPPAVYLHTVLAERRNREIARLTPAASPVAPASMQSPAPPPAASQPPVQLPMSAATPRPTVPENTAFTPPE